MSLSDQWPRVCKPMPRSMSLRRHRQVTPTSKAVGDMALFMVANDLGPSDVLDPNANWPSRPRWSIC